MDFASIAKLGGLLIPIVAILGGILMPLGIIFIVLNFRHRQREKLYETVKHFADRGLPVPRELLEPPSAPRRDDIFGTARFRAITLIGTGVGLALMFWSFNLVFLTGIGALLLCIGVAQLIAVRLDRGDRPAAPPPAHDGHA